MGLYNRARAAWSAFRSGPAGYGAGVAWSGGPLYADAFGAKRGPSPWQLVEAFKQINFACTEFNALGLAALPLRLYSVSGPGREKPRSWSEPRKVRRSEIHRLADLPYVRRGFASKDVEDVHEITHHQALDSIDNPAEDPKTGLQYFDRASFIATLSRYQDVVGIGYIKPEDESGNPFSALHGGPDKVFPTHLWPMQSQYVYPVRATNSALIQKFKYFLEEYDPGEMIYIRLRPSLRDPYGAGYAAAQAAWQYTGLEDKGISMWDQLLGTGARPNLIASPMDPNASFGDDERRRFEAEMNTFHARGRAGRFLATSAPLKFTPIQYPGFDQGEMHVNVYNMERMCNCWGVPVSFMSSETNLANFQAGLAFHAKFGIQPRAECLANALTRLVRRFDERLFFAFDGAISEDKEQKMRIIIERVKAGLITGNEANEDYPETPKPWLDEPWIPGTLVQPSMAAERHESNLSAVEAGNAAKAAGDIPADGKKKPKPKSADRALHREIRRTLALVRRELVS
jgi:hypothetical protein